MAQPNLPAILNSTRGFYELNELNKKREIAGLTQAMETFNFAKGLILTYDQEEEIEVRIHKSITRLALACLKARVCENNRKKHLSVACHGR